MDEQDATEVSNAHKEVSPPKKEEESGWGDVGSEMGRLMSGRWQIPKFLSCAYRTEVTPGEQCGFMLMPQLKGPARIRILEENKNCPLKEWAWGPCLKSYFAMPDRNKAGTVHSFLFVTLHKGPSNAPPRRLGNHAIESRKQTFNASSYILWAPLIKP